MLNSRHFIVPYDSSYHAHLNAHVFSYWSLKERFTLSSPYAFEAGDVVEVVSVDALNRVINILPVSKKGDISACLVFVSNDIPLSESETYEFEYNYCTPLLAHETIHNKNKLYTFALILESDHAYVRGYAKSSKQRLSFTITAKN